MKTAIVYASVHHGNTKKIIDEIAKTNDVELIDATDCRERLVGRFSCKGFDTFGPFKLIGGVSKGHPDEKDIAAAIEFYNGLKLKYD